MTLYLNVEVNLCLILRESMYDESAVSYFRLGTGLHRVLLSEKSIANTQASKPVKETDRYKAEALSE